MNQTHVYVLGTQANGGGGGGVGGLLQVAEKGVHSGDGKFFRRYWARFRRRYVRSRPPWRSASSSSPSRLPRRRPREFG